MENIGATNQSTEEAIGELVANSLDACENLQDTRITIDLRDDQIKVIDNGRGMTLDILEKAVLIAEDMSSHLERKEGAKGHFGMGFKTSCSTLGYYYEIFTRPTNKSIEYHVAFDIQEYIHRQSGENAWDVIIEDSTPQISSPLGNAKHGTAFVISQLKSKNRVPSAIRAYIEKAFKPDIKLGAQIKLVDEEDEYPIQIQNDTFIKGSRIEIDEKFGPSNKYHITGWMALDKQTNNNGFYGFNIYRKNQLVEQFNKSWFTAHLMTSRIFGEVNMDFLDATFYKQGVQQSSEGWLFAKDHMTEYLKGIVSASRDISRKGNVNSPTEVKRIIKNLHDDYGVADSNDGADEVMESPQNTSSSMPESIHDTIKNVVTVESLRLKNNEGEIAISYVEKDNNGISPFDYIFSEADEDEEEQKAELQVIVFKNHPLWKMKVEDKAKVVLAVQDSIYRMLVEKLRFNTSEALQIRNEWLSARLEKEH
jgi:Histidine kinase-, DNA gyrase B-, and HSP90-like ATPase.